MDLATFNRYRRTGVTKTTQALEALFRDRPKEVVRALDTTPFEGLPREFEVALKELGLSDEELNHIRNWPTEFKEAVRMAVVDAIKDDLTVRFAWKLHEASKEDTIISRDGPGTVEITFCSPWDNLRALGRDNVDVVANP